MAQVNPSHNTTALIIGTGEFSFSPDASSATNALAVGYLDFGNIVASTPTVEPTKEDHFGSYRGIRRKDRTIVTENKLTYTLRCDEWNHKNMEILLGATQGSDFTQSALSAVSGQAWAFNTTAAVIGRWYEIRTSGGAKLRSLTSVTITSLTEGTDFELDLLLGRIRFLTAQSLSRTPVITCDAITSGAVLSHATFTPLADPVKAGYGRLVLFDQHDANKVVYDHHDFSCEVTVESVAEVDGQSFAEITLSVSVTDTVGTVFVREENDNDTGV